MSTYKVKTGHNEALIDLVTIAPQPASAGVKAGRRTFSADGAIHDENLYIVLEWSVVEDSTDLATLLTQFGLASATTANVTIYCPSQLHVYTRYNGVAQRGEVSRNSYFLRDVQIVVKGLVAL